MDITTTTNPTTGDPTVDYILANMNTYRNCVILKPNGKSGAAFRLARFNAFCRIPDGPHSLFFQGPLAGKLATMFLHDLQASFPSWTKEEGLAYAKNIAARFKAAKVAPNHIGNTEVPDFKYHKNDVGSAHTSSDHGGKAAMTSELRSDHLWTYVVHPIGVCPKPISSCINTPWKRTNFEISGSVFFGHRRKETRISSVLIGMGSNIR
jgi:hypothetical protein